MGITRAKHAWPMVRLGDVCDVLDSLRKPITKKDRVAGDVPYYGATGIVDYVRDYIFDERLVLLGEDGAKWGAGEPSAFIVTGKTWVNNHAHVLRVHSELFDKYLVQYLNYSDLSPSITGVTVPKLNQRRMCDILVPLPPLNIQHEIVERLENELAEADSLAANFKRIAELADAEFKVELDEAFSAVKGNRVRIGDIGSLVRGSGIKRSDTVPHGRPCIRYGEIYTSFNYVLDQAKSFVPVELYDNCLHIKRGDLVLTLTGENTEEIGKTLAYLGDEEIAAGGDLAVWTNHACNPIYLSYLMYSSALLNAKAAASNGNIIVHASVKKLCDITIPIPSLSEQHLIAAKLDAAKNRCEHLKAAAKRGLRASETLRAAILTEAFAP